MHAGGRGGGDDRRCGRLRLEAGDVLGHRAGEQLHVLRQVAEMRSQRFRRPLVECRAVDPHPAADGSPHAHKNARQRRLARRARSDDSQPLSGLQLERHVLHDDPLRAGRHDAHRFDRQGMLGPGQRQARRFGGDLVQKDVEPSPALPRRHEAAPLRDREFDRRQGTRGQDRARDDDAGRGLLVDHQPRADAEHARLQRHAQHLGEPAEPGRDVGGALLGGHVVLIAVAPQGAQPARHAHRMDGFGVAPVRLGQAVATAGMKRRLGRWFARHDLGEQRDRDEDQSAGGRHDADQRMEQVADGEIERHPGQVEQRRRAHRRQERAHLVEVAQGCRPCEPAPLSGSFIST